MDKLPVCLWLLLWFPAMAAERLFSAIATKRPSGAWGDKERGLLAVLWLAGGVLLWPWK